MRSPIYIANRTTGLKENHFKIYLSKSWWADSVRAVRASVKELRRVLGIVSEFMGNR